MDLVACGLLAIASDAEWLVDRTAVYPSDSHSLVSLLQYLRSIFSRLTNLPTSSVKPATKSSQLPIVRTAVLYQADSRSLEIAVRPRTQSVKGWGAGNVYPKKPPALGPHTKARRNALPLPRVFEL
jgi:hypothetical protein